MRKHIKASPFVGVGWVGGRWAPARLLCKSDDDERSQGPPLPPPAARRDYSHLNCFRFLTAHFLALPQNPSCPVFRFCDLCRASKCVNTNDHRIFPMRGSAMCVSWVVSVRSLAVLIALGAPARVHIEASEPSSTDRTVTTAAKRSATVGIPTKPPIATASKLLTLCLVSPAPPPRIDDAKSHVEMGRALLNQNETEKALVEFETALRLDPKCSGAYAGRGLCFSEKSQIQKAWSDVELAIRLDPKNPDAYAARGFIALATKDLDKAINDFDAAIRSEPTSAERYVHRALTWSLKNDSVRAIADLDEAIRLDPSRARCIRQPWKCLVYPR